MTLGGLAAAIGLVIDDAIVVVENIVVHRDRGQARTEAVRSALREITTPLIGSTVTPVVVFLPLIAVTGVTGSFFRALAVTMTAALLTSLFLALTFTPALSLSLLRQSDGEAATKPISNSSAVTHDENGPFMRRVLELHRRALDWTIRRNWALAAIAVVLITSGYSAYSALGSNLLPEMDEGSFILDTTFPAGSSLAASQKMIGKVEEILKYSSPRVAPGCNLASRRSPSRTMGTLRFDSNKSALGAFKR
jgi:multidrug efflux pump subunit AcrB